MEGYSRSKEICPQFLDFIPKNRKWLEGRNEGRFEVSEEKKLELRLGPPGEDCSSIEQRREKDESLLSLRSFNTSASTKGGFSETIETKTGNKAWIKSNNGDFIQKPPSSFLMETQKQKNQPKNANTAMPNNSQKREAPASAVGWPPIRSFRKNIASSSFSKPVLESQNISPSSTNGNNGKTENCKKGLFVKINMDGVPIGRKIDLTAYDSYKKLSSAIDELFRDLLAAQRDSSATGNLNKTEEIKEVTGLLDGSGEYTLVYEDNEGDKMLVGDVPWNMFVSTVKRLRVLESSKLTAFYLGSSEQEKTALESGGR